MNSKPAGFVGKTQKFMSQDLWELEPESFSKPRRAGLKFLRVVMLVLKGFKEDKCPIHASSLTFTTVMAMVPLLVILFAIAKGFGFEQVSGMLLQKTADMPPAFQDAVKTILSTVGSASAGALGGAGVVFFLWAAIKMLSGIEDTFNLVWGIKTPRAFIEKVRNYIVILVVAPILLIVANTGLPIIMGFAGKLTWMGPVVTRALGMIPVFVMALTFTLVYIMMPNTKVRFSAAFTGAFVSAVFTVLFQFAIIKLGVLATSANKTYGTLAAIPLFLSWVQISWQIMLLGAEVAFSIQNAGTYARERLAVNPSARSRLCLAFALMKKITAVFEAGKGPFDTAAYGIANRVPVRLINDVIAILAKTGLVAEAAGQQGVAALLSGGAIADAILNEGADPNELGMKDDFPMFGKITNASFQTLEKQILKSF